MPSFCKGTLNQLIKKSERIYIMEHLLQPEVPCFVNKKWVELSMETSETGLRL